MFRNANIRATCRGFDSVKNFRENAFASISAKLDVKLEKGAGNCSAQNIAFSLTEYGPKISDVAMTLSKHSSMKPKVESLSLGHFLLTWNLQLLVSISLLHRYYLLSTIVLVLQYSVDYACARFQIQLKGANTRSCSLQTI